MDRRSSLERPGPSSRMDEGVTLHTNEAFGANFPRPRRPTILGQKPSETPKAAPRSHSSAFEWVRLPGTPRPSATPSVASLGLDEQEKAEKAEMLKAETPVAAPAGAESDSDIAPRSLSFDEASAQQKAEASDAILKMPNENRFLHVNALVVGESGLAVEEKYAASPPEETACPISAHSKVLQLDESSAMLLPGKTTFTRNLHQDFQGPDFKLWPHDGAETSMAAFKSDPDSLCIHLPKAVATDSGDWVCYHMQDTPGHGNIDDTAHMNMIIDHIRSKKYLQYDMERQLLQGIEPVGNKLCEARDDHLYDVAFYFIPPHRFKPADLEYIRRLSQEVTVVLVCAKADCMTMPERMEFQMGIRERMIQNDLPLFSLEEQVEKAMAALDFHDDKPHLPPFAVVCSNLRSEGKPERVYPWGTCSVDNAFHSDFRLIQQVIQCNGFHTLREKKRQLFLQYRKQQSRVETLQKQLVQAIIMLLVAIGVGGALSLFFMTRLSKT